MFSNRARIVWVSVAAGLVALLVWLVLPSSSGAVPAPLYPGVDVEHFEASASVYPETEPYLVPAERYFGAAVEGYPSSPAELDAFSVAAGAAPNLLMTFLGFGESFDPAALDATASSGALPVVSWEPWNHAAPDEDPFPLARIAAGEFDDYLYAQARLVGSMDSVVGIRLAHEMNADWYPWGTGVNGNAPEDYVAMFRHVHDVFSLAGAGNVIWIWSPNMVEKATPAPLSPLYPGDRYVDWVGVVGYLTSSDPYYGFEGMYRDTLAQLDVIAPEKPIVVTEISVSPQEDGTVRPRLIESMFDDMRATDRLVGFVWFNLDKRAHDRADWRLEVDPVAAEAFRDAFGEGGFAGLPLGD